MHGNDGLIFTSAESPYTPGTDPKMSVLFPFSLGSLIPLTDSFFEWGFSDWNGNLQQRIRLISYYNWNSLQVRRTNMNLILLRNLHSCCWWIMDMKEIIFGILWKWMMKLGNRQFFPSLLCLGEVKWADVYEVELSRWKVSGEQYDDRVVEVVWDQNRDTWKMLRFRDDKREGNFKTVVTSIIKSIKHGVEAEQVRRLSFSSTSLSRKLSVVLHSDVAACGSCRDYQESMESSRSGETESTKTSSSSSTATDDAATTRPIVSSSRSNEWWIQWRIQWRGRRRLWRWV